MKWSIPAKTFFLGEYAAIEGAPAIVLTTKPCFEMTLIDAPGLQGIHPESPAGLFWTQQGHTDHGVLWHDPYHGCGGMGASSAQWLGAWFASQYLQSARHPELARHPERSEGSPDLAPYLMPEIPHCVRDDVMLKAYFQSAWQGVGLRPSGYDVLAQSLRGCVYIHRQQAQCQSYAWPFEDLAFILLHTGQKLATHQHLQALNLTHQIESLAEIVKSAKAAFETADSTRVIDAVNAYHQQLLKLDLVATHSLQQIEALQKNPDILAIKGCGAMGADVLLLLVPKRRLADLSAMGLNILATSENLYLPISNN